MGPDRRVADQHAADLAAILQIFGGERAAFTVGVQAGVEADARSSGFEVVDDDRDRCGQAGPPVSSNTVGVHLRTARDECDDEADGNDSRGVPRMTRSIHSIFPGRP